MFAAVFLVVTFAGLVCLVWSGGWPERAIAVLMLINILITPFVEPYQIGDWRAGVALLELVVFLVMWAALEIKGRWWLTAAAGFQLIIVVSHLASLTGTYFTWTVVSARLGAAALLSLTFFIGAWEAWAARRFAREGAVTCLHNGPLKPPPTAG